MLLRLSKIKWERMSVAFQLTSFLKVKYFNNDNVNRNIYILYPFTSKSTLIRFNKPVNKYNWIKSYLWQRRNLRFLGNVKMEDWIKTCHYFLQLLTIYRISNSDIICLRQRKYIDFYIKTMYNTPGGACERQHSGHI